MRLCASLGPSDAAPLPWPESTPEARNTSITSAAARNRHSTDRCHSPPSALGAPNAVIASAPRRDIGQTVGEIILRASVRYAGSSDSVKPQPFIAIPMHEGRSRIPLKAGHTSYFWRFLTALARAQLRCTRLLNTILVLNDRWITFPIIRFHATSSGSLRRCPPKDRKIQNRTPPLSFARRSFFIA